MIYNHKNLGFATRDNVTDLPINFGQLQKVKDPISRTTWKLVILDQFVNFKMLYATLDWGYVQNDEPRDFVRESSSLVKDHAK